MTSVLTVRGHFERFFQLVEQAEYDRAYQALDAALEEVDDLMGTSGNPAKQNLQQISTEFLTECLSKARADLDTMVSASAARIEEKVEPLLFWSEALELFGQYRPTEDRSLSTRAEQVSHQLRGRADQECRHHYLLPLLARFMRESPLRTYRRFFRARR